MAAAEAGRLSVAIVILAAGRASRMGGGAHKLLSQFDGMPLIRRCVLRALGRGNSSIAVVTGYRHAEIAGAIADTGVEIVRNDAYASGLAGSLRLGVETALRAAPDGIMIMLADMPAITGAHLDLLIAAFRRHGGTCAVRATAGGRPGNPVIFPRLLHERLLVLDGDTGARHILASADVTVRDVEIGEAALMDVDTPDEVAAAGGILK